MITPIQVAYQKIRRAITEGREYFQISKYFIFFSTKKYQAYQEIGPRGNTGNGKRPISDPFIDVVRHRL